MIYTVASKEKVTALENTLKQYAENLITTLCNSGDIPYMTYPIKETVVKSCINLKASNWNGGWTLTAPYSGYYRVYCGGIINGNTQTRACYIQVDGVEVARNAEYSGGRDFGTTGFFVPKGRSITFDCACCKQVSLNCVHSA